MTDSAAPPIESERTCAGCREHSAREDLVRFSCVADVRLAAVGDAPKSAVTIVPDARRRLGGRGLSVHPRRRCFEAAFARGGASRSLRREVTADWRALASDVASNYSRRGSSLIIAASRQRVLAVGADMVRDAMNEGRLALLFVASDAGGSREDLLATARRIGSKCVVALDRATLGSLLGRGDVAVVGVLDEGIAVEVAQAFDCARELSEDG